MPMPTTVNNHFSAGHFKLVIDGKPVTAYIKGVEGGLINAQSVEEPVGQYNLRGRHLGATAHQQWWWRWGWWWGWLCAPAANWCRHV